MNKPIFTIALVTGLLCSNVAQAGPEVTPGAYRTEVAYHVDLGQVLGPAAACIYLAAPDADGNINALMELDNGFIHEYLCRQLPTGKVKDGKAPKVKAENSKLVSCVGDSQGNPPMSSLTFQIKGKNDRARLKEPRVVASTREVLFFADASLDATACPGP